jgi:hypothetical protein
VRGDRLPHPATVIAILALVVALGGVAWSAIPDGAGRVNACYNNIGGLVDRVVVLRDEGEQCPNDYVPVSWSQTGPPGAAGAQGPAGPQGPPGPQGPAAVTDRRPVIVRTFEDPPFTQPLDRPRLTLPAGNWAVVVKVVLGGQSAALECYTQTSSGLDRASASLLLPRGAGLPGRTPNWLVQTLTLTGAVASADAPFPLGVACLAVYPAAGRTRPRLERMTITAIPVAAVDVASIPPAPPLSRLRAEIRRDTDAVLRALR